MQNKFLLCGQNCDWQITIEKYAHQRKLKSEMQHSKGFYMYYQKSLALLKQGKFCCEKEKKKDRNLGHQFETDP